MIELHNINKIYQVNQHKVHALKNISLKIARGEIFGVLGKSGAGKSTLLRCVNLLERPTSGRVIVNDIDLTAMNNASLRAHRRKIGMVFQHFNLLESRTAFDNIALPLEIHKTSKSEIKHKVDSLLNLVGLETRKNYFPSQLSGGQKQRIAIARALAADPYILLCDEATSALDPESTKSVLSLLKEINQTLGLTILLITHELDVIKTICDRCGIINDGELVEQDAAINVIVNPKSTIAQKLVQHQLSFDIGNIPNDVLLLRLTFLGKDSDLPFISSLIRRFNVSVNIRQALIETIQQTTVGYTICELAGDAKQLQAALQFLHQTSIKVEVLNHAAN